MIALWILLLALLGGALWLWSKRGLKLSRIVDELSIQFFKSANVLVDDERTPTRIVDQLDWATENLRSPSVAWLIFRMVASGLVRERAANPTDADRAYDEDIKRMPPELRKQLAMASACLLLVLTYQLPILGRILRRFSLFAMQPKRRDDDDDFIQRIMLSGLGDHRHAQA